MPDGSAETTVTETTKLTATGNIVFPMSLAERLRFVWQVWCALGVLNDAAPPATRAINFKVERHA